MENLNYKLSVIVPVYNAEKYLSRCLESIINQTYQNLEIILVNDCSKDGSLNICESYAKKDSRIIVINNEKNIGQAASRNKGLRQSSGDYVTFVDNDDTIRENMYEILISDAVKNNCQISGCACLLVFENGKIINNYCNTPSGFKETKELTKKILMHADDAWGTVWNKVFSKNLKELLIFPEGKELEDYYVLINVYKKVDRIYFNNEPMYLWYQRTNSQSKRGYHKNIRTMLEVTEDIKKVLNDSSYKKELEFFEFVNRYTIITAMFKSKNKELYSKILDDIKEIKKTYNFAKKAKSDNRNVRVMIFKIRIIKIIIFFKSIITGVKGD